jgi:hypothetical protein
MNASQDGPETDSLSVKDLQNAVREETRTVLRAADLRIRELTNLSNEYASGVLSPAEATSKYMRFLDKWGDPFPGVAKAVVNLSDEQIHAEMENNLTAHVARIQKTRSR